MKTSPMKFSNNFLHNEAALSALRTGGSILAEVRDALADMVQPGITFEELERSAQRLLAERGAKPSFPTVEDYRWATCIVKNEGVCHGIPVGQTVEDGDVVSIDIGALYNGFHTDTTITVVAGKSTPEKDALLAAGKAALAAAIAQAVPGHSVYDISLAMETELQSRGFQAVYQLTGHGIGQKLHLAPNIPCVARKENKKIRLEEGMALAIEPMYAAGDPTLELAEDGWTYRTKDKSLSGMFEHTVLVRPGYPEVLTAGRQDTHLRKS